MEQPPKAGQLRAMGCLIGVLNGLFGSGGGTVAVPVLKKQGLSQKEAQATALSIMLPLSVVTLIFYTLRGNLAWEESWIYLPGGALGALAGSIWFKKIQNKWLKRIFALFVLFSGCKLLLQ